MLVFCEMTYVQQENNTAVWWAPAQLEDQNVHPNVWAEGDLSSVYKCKGFLIPCNFWSIIYQHTRELKRYLRMYKNK